MLRKSVNLAIVDDHSLFRKTLKNFLSEQANINVTIQASDMFDLLNRLKLSSVDILLMDLFMPGLNGNDALKTLRTEYPSMKILVLSMCTDQEFISELLSAGIHGYLSKSDEPDDLLGAIWAAADGKIYRNHYFTEALYRDKQNNFDTFSQGGEISLSDREKKILQLIWEEKGNKEIADELFLGIRSVEKIRQALKEKIGVKSTIGMLKYGIKRKIIGLNFRNADLADRVARIT
jgi:DNA-binding NarL/FixJ family response regulator